MAWKIRLDAVGSPAWHELRRQRDIARSWISDVAPLRKKRKLGGTLNPAHPLSAIGAETDIARILPHVVVTRSRHGSNAIRSPRRRARVGYAESLGRAPWRSLG
jgi:hypothetical protein